MSITLSDRLSAVVQDSAGTSHIVWLEGTNIWHAVYDPVSQTWKNAQAIVNTAGQNIRSLNLVADSGLIVESGTSNNTLIPGVAVIYQEGLENDSNFFYTAARYDNVGKLQWLEAPQALTADQVGDLEPRAVVDNGVITVVGQKVDLVKAQNQAIREDADPYYQTFQIYSNQFSTIPSTPVTPIAAYAPQITKDGVVQGNYIQRDQNTVAALPSATYQPLTLAETQSSSFQGWGANWTVSQTFDTNLSNLKLFKGMAGVPEALLTPIFKKFNITGTLLGSSGNNPNLSFFGGGISTEGILLNASMAVQFNEDDQDTNNTSSGTAGSSLNPAENTTQLSRKPEISLSAIAATLYTFDKSLGEDNLSYPLTVETGSLGLTVGFTFPIPIEGTPILFNFLGSAGLGMQWQLSPKDPQTYVSPVGAVLSPTGGDSDAVLAVLFNVPPLGAITAIGLAVISDITEVVELIFTDVDPDGNEAIELESLLFSIPIATGIDGGIKIPYVFEALAGIQASLVGTVGGTRSADNGAFQYDRDLSLGFPMNITIKFLGFLGGTVGIYPYWTWGDDPSSSASNSDFATLNQASADSPTAIVRGPLLEIQGLQTNGTPQATDFQVNVKDPLGQTTTVPVFGVITQGNTTILRLESAIPQTNLNDQPFSNIKVTYQNNAPIPVVNQSANTFTYNYNPISGTNSNYQVTGQQVVIAFNATLNPNIIPDSSLFQVTDTNGNSISISSVIVTSRSVILTLSGSSSTYSVSYSGSSSSGNVLTTEDNVAISDFKIASNTPPSTAGQVNRTYSNVPAGTTSAITTNPLLGSTVAQDYAEDSPPALAVTDSGVLLAWSSDTPPITPISALLSGTTIILTFADTLVNLINTNKATSNPFTVLINNQSVEIQDSSSTGNYVAISLNSSTVIDADDTISVSYSIDSTLENSLFNLYLSDATDFALWVPDFTTPVTQAASSTNAPTLLEAVAISNVITLTFDQILSSSNLPPGSQFKVTVNNSDNFITVINEVTIENNSVTLPLSEPIGQGDIVTVSYSSGAGTLVNSNNIPVAPFTTSDILTTFANPGTVIKTLLATPSTSSVSIAYPSSIIGTSGLNYDPAVYFNQATNQVFAAWVNVDSSQIQNQLIPGQYYSNLEIITQALQSSTIYFSVASLKDLGDLGPNGQIIPWSVAAPIPHQQTGQNTNVTLGLGPDGSIMAAWLNTTLDNNGTPTTTIYYSTLNQNDSSPVWSAPVPILPDINPDAFTPLTISTINQQPAIFWTESSPASYRQLVLNAAPSVYLRLGERTGDVARNSGQFQAAANGTYSGTFTLGEMGALETTSNTGDPNPAVLFQGGGVTLDQPVPLTNQAFAIEFWFKLPNLPRESINLVSALGLFGLGLEVDPNDPNAPPKLTFGLGNDDQSQIQASETFATDVWYYVVGTYDGSSQNLSLYLNGVLAGTLDDVEFDPFPTAAALALAGASTANNPVYLDEVAFYPKALTASNVNAADLTNANFQNLTGSQILEIIAGTNQIGNHYAAQYNQPVPPGPNTYYSVSDGSSWQLPSQINPTPAIVPTQLAGANIPVFDLVSATPAQASTAIAPNGIADAVYQISLSNPNLTISGIKVTSGNQAWAIGTDDNGTALTGNQLGLLLGDTLLNSLNPDTQSFSYPIQGYTENLFLFIDPGSSNTTLGPVEVTVYFENNDNTPTPFSVAPYQINMATMGPDQTVTGTATVTEANDSSLALIDSGFIINSDNPAIGYVLASAFNSDGTLAYVAVGNRGYSDSQGNVLNNGTVQILFSCSDILSGSGSLSTTILNGNPDGVLITNIQDAGDNQRNLSLSLATGDIDGDSIPDLVIGAPNVGNFAGAVYVIYGSYLSNQKGQIIDVTNLSTKPNTMGFVVNGNEAEDLAGFSVVVGNFDGDSYGDIVYGAPYAKDSNGNRVGQVYLVAGFAQGSAPDSISPTVIYSGKSFDIPNPQPNPPSQTLTVGEGAGFALGVSRRLSNGPSTFTGSTTTDDLFIGAPNYQIQVVNQWTNQSNLPGQNSQNQQNQQITSDLFPSSSFVSAGAVYVYNSNQGLSLKTNPWAIYTGPTIPNAQGTATSYFAGTVIGSGLNTDFTDYDGDGRQDLVIAGPGANTNTGQAFVIGGSTATPSVTTTQSGITTTTTQALNTVSNLVINGGLSGGKAGTVITSVGDLNHDGYQDLLITAPQGANATGQSYVLFGTLNLSEFGTVFDLNVTANDNKTTFLLNGDQPFQATGTAAVGVGDINNDGVDDLMLTAPVGQQLYAVYGHPWLADDGSIKLADVSSNNGFVIDGYEYSLPSSPFGYVLSFDLVYGNDFELVSAWLQLISPTGQVIWRSNPGEGVTVTPEAYAIMQSDGNFVIYGQPGGNSGDVIWSSNTAGNSGAVLKLASDGGLYIVDSEGNIVPNGTLNPGNTSLITNAVTLDENQEINISLDTFLSNGENGGSLFGNGLNIVMVGDVNGDGFADVISGGSPAGGVLIFGNSTKDLLDAALGTDDLIISVENAQVKEFVALGDFDGDGLADFGVIDDQGNFFLVLGSPELGSQGSLVIDSTLPNLSNFNQAWGVGDFNGNGYDDFVLQGPNSTIAVYGNANGTLTDSSPLTFGNNFPLPSSFTGIDLNGNGIKEIVAGQPNLNPVPNIGGFGGGLQYFTYEAGNAVLQPTVNPPNASVTEASGLSSWGQISFPNQYAQAGVPSFATLDGWLYQAFYGINERISTKDSYIYIQRSRDGVSWENLTQVVPLDSNGTPIDLKNLPPSITAYNGTLYLGFTADNGQVWVAEGVNTNANSGILINAVPINQASNNGPTLVAFNDELYVFFVKDASDNDILYSSSSNPGSSSGWDGTSTVLTFSDVNQATNFPLSATVVPGLDGDTLAVAFRSNNSPATWVGLLNSSDVTNWQGSAELTQVDANSQVSLTVVDGTYYLFFTSSTEASASYATSTDGLNWGDITLIPWDDGNLGGVASILFNQSFILSLNQSNNESLLFAFSNSLFEPNQASRWGEQVRDIGDFNGDGIADLAVLAPGYRNLLQFPILDYPAINNLGGVFIYYGEESGISVNDPPDVVLAAPDLPQETIFELLEITPTGDVNGDGFDDLLISAPLTPVIAGQFPDVNGDQGVSWVVFGGTHWGTEYTANSPFGLGNLANNQTNNSQNFNPYGFVTTGLPRSQAGISISGGADVNGDGFSDFALGAPGNFDNLSYVLFGSDFTNQVNQLGTIGDDVMLGSPTGEIFVAGQGDDQIYTNGGVDTVYAGPGNDFVTVTDTNFRRLDGGSGNNILKFTGYTNQDWDLTTLSPGLRLKNFNILDVRDYGANILTLNALTITQLSANNEVRVLLDANDKINLDSSFSFSEKVYLDNQNYYLYTSNASAATVLVNVPSNQVTFTATTSNSPSLNLIPTAQPNAPTTTDVTILAATNSDPNQPTRLFVSNPKVSEAAGEAQFVIERTGDLNKYVLVSYITQDMSGKAGDRYLPIAGPFCYEHL